MTTATKVKKFNKIVILDTVIFYPEHRELLNSLAHEVVEYPSSLPESLERQYVDSPELFKNTKCYTELGANNTPLQLLMNRCEGADVIISCWTNIPDEILKANKNLKLVVFWTHEKEHRINVPLAEQLGISVKNIPDYGTHAVKEAVFAGFWKILEKNYQTKRVSPQNEAHKIVGFLFDAYRKIDQNEKNTRKGKFSHHFHKLGQASFDFTEKNLDELIPEKLIEKKNVGLLGIDNPSLMAMLSALNVNVETMEKIDFDDAEFYKFLVENEYVFINAKNLDPIDIKQLQMIKKEKLVDINTLENIEYDFSEKTFGIVGMGRIATEVAKIAKKLGFTVIYNSRTRKVELEEKLDILYVDLETLLKQSDVVSVHVSAHKAENLLDADKIALMKKGAIFINTADGNALDQVALTKRMEKGEIVAYLDVYPGLPRKDILGLPMVDKDDWKLKDALDKWS